MREAQQRLQPALHDDGGLVRRVDREVRDRARRVLLHVGVVVAQAGDERCEPIGGDDVHLVVVVRRQREERAARVVRHGRVLRAAQQRDERRQRALRHERRLVLGVRGQVRDGAGGLQVHVVRL